jgi:colanic acid/amylovoran biosynthesis glycosyltransferase
MRERRVAFVLYEFPSPTQTFVLDPIERLLARGVDVLVFVRRRAYTTTAPPPLHAGYERIAWRRRTLQLGDDERWGRAGRLLRGVGRAVAAAARSPAETLRLLRRTAALPASLRHRSATLLHALPFAGRGIDLVHVHFTWTGWGWEDVAEALGLPLVVGVYGADVALAGDDGAHRNAALFARADAIVCSSRHLERAALALGAPAERTRVLHPAIDCDFFSPAPGEISCDPPVLLTVARLHAKKGLADGLRAIGRLRAAGVRVRWRIAGGGPEEHALRAEIDAAGLADCVELAGTLERGAVRDALRSAALFFLPSRHEEFGVAAAEAQACGLAVVATRVGGLPEIVEDGATGVLVPTRDDAAMAAALGALLRDAGARRAMGARGRERVRARFGSERAFDALPALYASLLVARRGVRQRALAPAH